VAKSNKGRLCANLECDERVYGWVDRCPEHQREEELWRARQERAERALHGGTNDISDLTSALEPLVASFQRVQERWRVMCLVRNSRLSHPLVPFSRWLQVARCCSRVAAELLEAIDAVRAGQRPSADLGRSEETGWRELRSYEASSAGA